MSEAADPNAFEIILDLMLRHGVEFIVIGGLAEQMMGSPRITYDVDLCYSRQPKNLEKLAAALREIDSRLRGAPPDVPFILDAKTLGMGQNFTFDTSVIALDLLGWVEPIGTFDELIESAEQHVYKGRDVRAIALDQLIRIKEHINRPKDRESLFQLRAIKQVREEQGGSG